MLNKAIATAAEAHTGQFDKGGDAYILHPLRVMMLCKSESEKIAAVLHDVVEDSDITLKDLAAAGFPPDIIAALECLTKRPGEDYFDFVRRAATNPIARCVKLADLADNSNLSRIPNPSSVDRERAEKYRRAIEILNGENC